MVYSRYGHCRPRLEGPFRGGRRRAGIDEIELRSTLLCRRARKAVIKVLQGDEQLLTDMMAGRRDAPSSQKHGTPVYNSKEGKALPVIMDKETLRPGLHGLPD